MAPSRGQLARTREGRRYAKMLRERRRKPQRRSTAEREQRPPILHPAMGPAAGPPTSSAGVYLEDLDRAAAWAAESLNREIIDAARVVLERLITMAVERDTALADLTAARRQIAQLQMDTTSAGDLASGTTTSVAADGTTKASTTTTKVGDEEEDEEDEERRRQREEADALEHGVTVIRGYGRITIAGRQFEFVPEGGGPP